LCQILYFLSFNLQYFTVDEYAIEDNEGINESESSEAVPSDSSPHLQPSQTVEKDIMMVKF